MTSKAKLPMVWEHGHVCHYYYILVTFLRSWFTCNVYDPTFAVRQIYYTRHFERILRTPASPPSMSVKRFSIRFKSFIQFIKGWKTGRSPVVDEHRVCSEAAHFPQKCVRWNSGTCSNYRPVICLTFRMSCLTVLYTLVEQSVFETKRTRFSETLSKMCF